MQYDFPKEIQIGGHVYKVILKDAALVDECCHNQGDSCQATLEIRVSTVTGDGAQRGTSTIEETLWHEILHQIDDVYVTKDKLDERDIERLSQGLLQIFSQLDWHIVREK